MIAPNRVIISRDDAIYEAWPDVTLTKGGKLICVFMECAAHSNRDKTRLVYCESLDRGKTWSEKKALTEPTDGWPFLDCARISRLKDDSLAILCANVEEGFGDKSTICIWYGDSEGTKWDGPYETPAKGIVPDKLLELENGRWIISSHEKNVETKKNEQFLWYSDDKGKTWSDRIVVGRSENLNLCEVSILPTSEGVLVAFMRENSNQGWDCYKSISYDNGETWSDVHRFPLPGCHRPVSGKLQSGLILITYRFKQGGKAKLSVFDSYDNKPFTVMTGQNMFAAITDESSILATERGDMCTRIMPIDFDRNKNSDIGYTGWVQFENGDIYIVNYIVDDSPNSQIVGYTIREEDIIIL